MQTHLVLALSLILGATTPFAAQTGPEDGRSPMSIVDLINIPSMSGIQLSPDGTQILYVLSEADWDRNKSIAHIWRVDSTGTGTVKMTNGENGESGPVWSPDGSRIAFIAKRNDDDHAQIWVINNAGGEAIRLSEHPTSVASLAWPGDGRYIYYRAVDEKTEAEKAREELKDNVFRFDEDKKNAHIWRIDVDSGARERLTGGEYSVGRYGLSRDGRLIAYSRAPSPLLDDRPLAEIWLMAPGDTTGGTQLTNNGVFEEGFEIAPDNGSVWFFADTNDDLEDYYYNRRLFVISIEDRDAACLVCGGQYNVNAARWSDDGTSVFFRADQGVRRNLYRVGYPAGEISPVTAGDHALFHWDYEPGAGVHAYSFSSPTDPGDIRLAGSDGTGMKKVTRIFDYVADGFRLPRVEAVRWTGEDGMTVEGLVYFPLGFEEGRRYPLVVQTHGGPASVDLFRFPRSVNYESVLAAMGYMVFKPNYRGSTAYGDEFLRDMVGHYFNQAHKDVMTGVDALIERGWVDGSRMAKMGWSAGGHMTNKIITYTDRFKAASSGAGAVNWVSMYGQSDVRTYRTPWFGGDPWSEDSPIDQYIADSPVFDMYRVTTPTLVLVGENDARVPMAQSVELYRALRENGVPTHLYIAPDQGHGWRELQQRLFKANVELDWFERWVNDRTYEWEKSPVEEPDEHPDGP